MQTIDSCTFHFDRLLYFYDYFRVEGWFHSATERLAGIDLVHGEETVLRDVGVLALPSPDIHLDPNCRFVVSELVRRPERIPQCALRMRLASGRSLLAPLRQEDQRERELDGLFEKFVEMVRAKEGAAVLEVGSRSRSGVIRRHLFEPGSYVGIDVLPGENVDHVVDAHRLSAELGRGRFDFTFSTAVLEHLAMPWKVVVELNRVLRTGGVAYVWSVQTCGLHDLPWDYFRFSDSAYRALFNRWTGFEVLDLRMSKPMHTIPMVRDSSSWDDVERAAGFYVSEVIARKVSDTTLDWEVPAHDLVEEAYPA